jgi:CheY-like chemotaxis protein/anti-sigma regulatory factor (Ser/Thr protein kinase)
MSHELRTPLNAIIGFTRIVQRKGEGLLPQKQLDNLDKVLSSSDHLLGLINTVLDIAKIEAGRMEVQAVQFELPPLVNLVQTTTHPLLRANVQLAADLEPDLPTLHSDPDKIKQILINLLSNAAKFTHQGNITIKARLEGKRLKVSVADTGIGISPQSLERVFEEFQQADTSTTRQYGGTGLGLSISRNLARLLEGDLTVESQEGVGSTFTLDIPLIYGDGAAFQASSAASAGSMDRVQTGVEWVLVIDDHQDAIELMRETLEEAGYRVAATQSGEEGLRLARELSPLAITLDIMMPNKDGWKVLHELKADPLTHKIPVILVTIVDKKTLGYQSGAADYLLKPLNANDLLESLARVTGQQPGSRLWVADVDPEAHHG